MTHKLFLYGFTALAVLMFAYLMLVIPSVDASAPPGLKTTVAVATTTTVGPQQNIQLFTANSACNSRIISTTGQGIMLIFADPTNGDVSSTTLSGAKGHWQAASTTVAYDSGLYGCGRTFGYAGASSTVMLTETR